MNTESVWQGKYKSIKEYYLANYNTEYFHFEPCQFEIDPDETIEDLEQYDDKTQFKEIMRCGISFPYFCHKYVKILHPVQGLQPFILYKYQNKVIDNCNTHRFNIVRKFRQAGLTTLALIKGIHMCLFDQDQQIMLLSKTDREAIDVGMIVDRVIENLPDWMKPNTADKKNKKKQTKKWNDHLKTFSTGGSMKFWSVEAARGKSVKFLIIDEAAFIEGLHEHWAAIWPVLSTGGSAILVSTVNGRGNFYEECYTGAKNKSNLFNPIDLTYTEHPDYCKPGWAEEQRMQLGEKKFRQEILAEFLGTGENYFPNSTIIELVEQTKENVPYRKLYPKWINKAGAFVSLEESTHEKGALWLWKEPIPGHDYIISSDCGEGMGEDNDNSCFQVIDENTSEQVAEFYSNIILPHEFAQLIHQMGLFYNTALVVVENMHPGNAVLSYLQHHLFYENLYYDDEKKLNRPGVKINPANRGLLLESLKNSLVNRTIKVNSYRFSMELETFKYDNNKKAKAEKGTHDDAIFAFALGLYIKEKKQNTLPIGMTKTPVSSAIKQEVYDEIRRELLDGFNLGVNPEEKDYLKEDSPPLIFRRKNDSILREFGW